MKSSLLRDAISEVDTTCEKLAFFACPSSSSLPSLPGILSIHGKPRPVFRIRGVGTFATTDVDYPNTHDVLETFECEEPVEFSYAFKPLHRIVRSLQTAVKSAVRIDGSGMLGVQFMLPELKGKFAYVDFVCEPRGE